MKRLQNELTAFINRGVDRHLRLAVTGLSRSGKTAFITSLVNQLINVHTGARLPLFSAARNKQLLGVKRIPQHNLNIPRFTYDEGMESLYHTPPSWPVPTKGVSEIRLQLRYRSNESLTRFIKETSSLYLEIVDYPGEWLLDLPMLEQDYFEWSEQINKVNRQRTSPEQNWQLLLKKCDPFAQADETLLADIASAYTDYLLACKKEGLHFIQPGRFVLPGELAGAPVLQFFPWADLQKYDIAKLKNADKRTNIGMLKQRYEYYGQHVVKGFYRDHFQGFDRQIVLVDCLQPLNQGVDVFNDMRQALTQLMRSFHYGKRTLLRRLFSPCIDKLLFAATKADHITVDQHENLVSLLQQLIQDAKQNAIFEGISIDCMGLASIAATESGIVDHHGEKIPALKGFRLSDNKPLVYFPGEVPKRLPEKAFWEKQGFSFESFRPQQISRDSAVPHIRMDSAMEFLLGDKLK